MFPNFFQTFPNILTQKQEIISELISELFLQNFCKFEKTRYFKKSTELWKPNYSKTRKNKKFRKFHLTQGLSSKLVRLPRLISLQLDQAFFSKIWI